MSMSISYTGVREGVGLATVHVNGSGAIYPLPLCLDVRKHSPTGFEWGYWGSGPAQLSLALCVHALTAHLATGDQRASFPVPRALRVYQHVKERLVGPIQTDTWTLTQEEVLAAIWAVEEKHGALEIETCERHPHRQYPAASMGYRSAFCPDCREEERRLEEEEERRLGEGKGL